MELTVVRVVARERRDGAGEEKVESAAWVVDCPAAVTAVFAPKLRAVARSVATVGAADVPCLIALALPSREER